MSKIKLVIEFDDSISNRPASELIKKMYEDGDIDVKELFIDGIQKEVPPREDSIALEDPSGSEADGSDREGESGVVPEKQLEAKPILGSSDRDEALPILDDQGGNAQPQARG